MLKWYKLENSIGFMGFEDDTCRYWVKQDENGWYWEDNDCNGECGYTTAEEAMEAAEANLPEPSEEEEGYALEDALLDYWDAVAHERMEIAKGFI